MRFVHAEEGSLAEATMQPQSPDEPEAKSKATLQQHLASLTARERMVLTLLCQGKSNKQIGRELAIVETTAKVHVCRIMKKLRVHNRTQVFAAVGHLL